MLIEFKGNGRGWIDLKTLGTVIFPTYDGLDVVFVCSWAYASGL